MSDRVTVRQGHSVITVMTHSGEYVRVCTCTFESNDIEVVDGKVSRDIPRQSKGCPFNRL